MANSQFALDFSEAAAPSSPRPTSAFAAAGSVGRADVRMVALLVWGLDAVGGLDE